MVRNRTMKVGKQLQKSADALAVPSKSEPCEEVVVGLDGGYIRARHQRPERNFEVVVGKVFDRDGNATRLAFVRNGGSKAVTAAGLAFRRHGVNENTSVTVLTDGDAGLRAIHQQVAPKGEHVLDWFHIGMKFENLKQFAKGINGITDGAIRGYALAQLDRAKWRFWNGHTERGLIGLVHLRQWARGHCFEHIHSLGKLARVLLDTIRYLELNADSMPNYGNRYRGRLRISIGFAESAVSPFSTYAFTFSMAPWKMHSVIGTKAFGHSQTCPSSLRQRDTPQLCMLPIRSIRRSSLTATRTC